MDAMTMEQLTAENQGRRLALDTMKRFAGIIRTLDTWRLRHKSRAQFAGLDARILRDSGIDDAHRFIESNKPFWKA